MNYALLASLQNAGSNIGNFGLDLIFWLALVAIGAALASCLLKRNFVGAILVGIAGGVVLYIIKNPAFLQSIGESLVNIIFQ